MMNSSVTSPKSAKYGIEAYFTAEEFAELSEYEKLRLRNMKQNYEMMVKVGLDVPPPEFMRDPVKNIASQQSGRRADGSSTPARIKGHKRSVSFKVPTKKKPRTEHRVKKIPATISTAPMSDAEFAAIAADVMSDDEFDGIDFEADFAADVKPVAEANKSTESEQSGRKRYSLREGTRKSYKDLEVAEDDVYVYCEDCHELYEDDCPSHPLIIIKDSPVPVKCKHRAKLSLPPGLVVKEAGIQGAGDGVWAEKFFPRGVRFGPYGGEILKERAGKESGYAWEIFQDKKRIHYINGKKRSTANWMRYVNCARNESEQNLIAFQYRSQIYYRSFKPIYPGNELLVYYGEEYAKELGIEECTFEDDGSDHTCHICSRIFTGKLFLLKHLKYRHHQFIDLSLYRNKDSPLNQTLCKAIDPSQQQTKGSNGMQGEVTASRNRSAESKTVENDVGLHSKFKVNAIDRLVTDGPRGYMETGVRLQPKLKVNAIEGVGTGGQRGQTGNGLHQCRVCSKRLSTKQGLELHERMHTGVKPYKCTQSQCNKTFVQLTSLTFHERTHTGIKPYKCTRCNKAYAQIGHLTRHERTHTGVKPYKCDKCGKAFAHLNSLTDHERTHTGIRPYKCTQCDKAFTVLCNLIRHERTHTGIKPYKCTHCDKAFAQLGDLTKHERTHTGVKPYKCTQCDKAFTQSQHLTYHERTHTGIKPYKCTQCDKAFTQINNLTRHERTHTGVKPYKCTHCDKAFADQKNLTTHERTHTGIKPYKCTQCDKTFSDQSNLNQLLNQHKRTHPDL